MLFLMPVPGVTLRQTGYVLGDKLFLLKTVNVIKEERKNQAN